jgi:hypothetical protein
MIFPIDYDIRGKTLPTTCRTAGLIVNRLTKSIRDRLGLIGANVFRCRRRPIDRLPAAVLAVRLIMARNVVNLGQNLSAIVLQSLRKRLAGRGEPRVEPRLPGSERVTH